jgi:hypothetical protein
MTHSEPITHKEHALNARETGIKEDWLRALDAYHVRFLVLNRQSERDLVNYFRSLPGWGIDFEDSESIIFARAVVPDAGDKETS